MWWKKASCVRAGVWDNDCVRSSADCGRCGLICPAQTTCHQSVSLVCQCPLFSRPISRRAKGPLLMMDGWFSHRILVTCGIISVSRYEVRWSWQLLRLRSVMVWSWCVGVLDSLDAFRDRRSQVDDGPYCRHLVRPRAAGRGRGSVWSVRAGAGREYGEPGPARLGGGEGGGASTTRPLRPGPLHPIRLPGRTLHAPAPRCQSLFAIGSVRDPGGACAGCGRA